MLGIHLLKIHLTCLYHIKDRGGVMFPATWDPHSTSPKKHPPEAVISWRMLHLLDDFPIQSHIGDFLATFDYRRLVMFFFFRSFLGVTIYPQIPPKLNSLRSLQICPAVWTEICQLHLVPQVWAAPVCLPEMMVRMLESSPKLPNNCCSGMILNRIHTQIITDMVWWLWHVMPIYWLLGSYNMPIPSIPNTRPGWRQSDNIWRTGGEPAGE